jgi:hypothetical protein
MDGGAGNDTELIVCADDKIPVTFLLDYFARRDKSTSLQRQGGTAAAIVSSRTGLFMRRRTFKIKVAETFNRPARMERARRRP